MKKIFSLWLVTVMLLAVFTLSPAADETKPTPTFSYDFSAGLTDEIADPNNRIQLSYENADGYVTFRSEGDDPYFRFSDGYEPNVTTENLAYAVMKYRTTASIASGEFFTNRHSGPQWGGAGTHVTWAYRNDGNWHAVVIDNTVAWGATTGDSLYAFRLDPLASGATAGDTIDIAYIHFFATKADAEMYARAEFPDDIPEETETDPAETYTVLFQVDGETIYTVTYEKGATEIKVPVVPVRPGYNGVWEAYQLSDQDLTVHAIYTPDETAETAPEMPPETESPTESGSETETEPETGLATETETGKTSSGCDATAAFSSVSLMAAIGYAVFRKKNRKSQMLEKGTD